MKLTQTVKKGGCAAKVAASELRNILSKIDFPLPQKNLIINGASFDDAAVYKTSETQSLVSTLDFFTPIVDTPYLFGQIAAANAMSDVYAMGGTPILALAILAFPLISMDSAVITEIIQGAVDKLKEAPADLAGGHTIDDDTLKFGLSVTGLVSNNKILSNAKAKTGDVLILTKALGTGTLMASLKNNFKTEPQLTEAISSMCQLNDLSLCLDENDRQHIHAMTDVTGFGLAGHALQMAQASQVSLKIQASKLPKLAHVTETLNNNFLTKAHKTNRDYVQKHLHIGQNVADVDQLLFFDPQTSGGLLLSVDEKYANHIYNKVKEHFPKTSIIGEVLQNQNTKLFLSHI